MKTITITTTYNLIWQLNFDSNYALTKCGKMFNLKRNKEVKCVLNGSTAGYWINKKFYSLKNLRNNLQKIENNYCPF